MANGYKSGFSRKRLVTLFKSTAFKVTAMLALFLSSLLIAMAMLLGEHAGVFVIRVQSGDVEKSIHITENPDYTQGLTKTLRPKGFDNMTDISPEYFIEEGFQKIYNYTEEPGLLQEENCLYVYTFYIVNTGTGAVGVDIEMNIKSVTKDLDDIVRVMTFYDYKDTVSAKIYQKKDTIPFNYPMYNVIAPQPFVNNDVVFRENVNISFMDGEDALKYSVFFWLEGNDPDSTPETAPKYYGATIQFELDLKVSM